MKLGVTDRFDQLQVSHHNGTYQTPTSAQQKNHPRMAFSMPVETPSFLQQHPSSLLQAPAPHHSHQSSHAIAQHHHQLYQQHRAAQQAAQQAAHQTTRSVQPLAPPPYVPQHLQLGASQAPRTSQNRAIPSGIQQQQQPLLNTQRARPQPAQALPQDVTPVFDNHQAQPNSQTLQTHANPIAQLGATAEPGAHREYEGRSQPYQMMNGTAAHRIAPPSSSIPQLLSGSKMNDNGARRWGTAAPYQGTGLPEAPNGASAAAQARTNRGMRQYGEAAPRAYPDEGSGAGGDAVGGQGMLGHWFTTVGETMPGMTHDGESRGVLGAEGVPGVGAMAINGAAGLPHTVALGGQSRDERNRLALVRPQFKPASDDEKRERHNKHTKQSRKRIDDKIKELKEALKKMRPNVKLGHKAEIVGEAVKFILETYHLQQATQMMDSSLSN